jgi:protein-tyrosine phosphatase
MNSILVLCIGNICRSPMAEALLKKELPDMTVRSAGLGALIGNPADPFSVKIMAEEGIDISGHRAQQISSDLVADADLILVMDSGQKKHVESRYTQARGKVFRLCEPLKADVPDPYREGIDNFRASHQLIASGVSFWREQIMQLRR